MHFVARILSHCLFKPECQRSAETGETLCLRAHLLLHTDDVVNLVNNSIRGDDIALGNASVLHLRATVAVQLQTLLIDGFRSANEWPIGLYDSGTANHVRDDVRSNDVIQIVRALHRFIEPFLDFQEYVILRHKHGQTFVRGTEKFGEIRLFDQLQEHAVIGIGSEGSKDILEKV